VQSAPVVTRFQAHNKLARDMASGKRRRPSEAKKPCMTPPPQVPTGRHSSLAWTIVVDHRGFPKSCGLEVFDLQGEIRVWLGN
jgi:hypothetical protein